MLSVSFSFPTDELTALRKAPMEEVGEVLSILECELSIRLDDENPLLMVHQVDPSFEELSSGRIGKVLWWESAVNVLEAVSDITGGDEEAEACLVASRFFLQFLRQESHVGVYLRDEGERRHPIGTFRDSEVAQAFLAACANAIGQIRACRTDVGVLNILRRLEGKTEDLKVQLQQLS